MQYFSLFYLRFYIMYSSVDRRGIFVESALLMNSYCCLKFDGKMYKYNVKKIIVREPKTHLTKYN